jgi:hypothetical protein
MLKTFCKIIQQSAKENIPRGKPRNYKPFWTQELNKQKKIIETKLDKKLKNQIYTKTRQFGERKNKIDTSNNTIKEKGLEYIFDKVELQNRRTKSI